MKKVLGPVIIASGLIWAMMIIGCALILRGTEYKDDVTLMLTGGVVAHLLIIWFPLIRQIAKLTDK